MTSSPVDLTVLIDNVIPAYETWSSILGTVVGMAVGKQVILPGKPRSLGASTTTATKARWYDYYTYIYQNVCFFFVIISWIPSSRAQVAVCCDEIEILCPFMRPLTFFHTPVRI